MKKLSILKEEKDKTSAMVIVASLEKQAKPLERKLTALPIKTQDEYNSAALLMSNLKELGKRAKAEEDGMTQGIKQSLKAIVAHFKPFYDAVALTEVQTKQRMTAFIDAQEAKVVKLHQDFEDGKIKKIGTIATKENSLLNVSNENSSVRKIRKLIIKDERKIPRDYMIPDEAAIVTAFKAGHAVPGCEWVLVNNIAI